MRLQLSARKLALPNTCACCGRVADGKIAATAARESGDAKTWELPYCGRCLAHVAAWEKAPLAVPLMAVVVVAVCVMPVSIRASIAVAVLGFAGTIALFATRRAAARKLLRPECVTAGRAARYLGWKGSVHTFELANPAFARDFATANEEKIVGAAPPPAPPRTPEIVDWMRARAGRLVPMDDVAIERGKARMTRGEAIAVAKLLETNGVGLEPDPRASAKTPPTSFVPFTGGRAWEATAAWRTATLVVRLAQVVAELDDEQERALLVKRLGELLPVDPARLDAHVKWVALAKPKATLFKKKLGELPAEARARLGELLVEIAQADGKIVPAEIDALARAFGALGLDPKEVHRRLHGDAPAAPQQTLDMDAVKKKLEETERAAAILGDIFVEEEEEEPVSTGRLDAKHAKLFAALAARPSWPRADAEALAKAQGLMLGGALETINDVAFETAGQAALEGDDPIDVVLKELP